MQSVMHTSCSSTFFLCSDYTAQFHFFSPRDPPLAHLALSPSTILLDQNFTAKLSNLGISHILSSSSSASSQHASPAGMSSFSRIIALGASEVTATSRSPALLQGDTANLVSLSDAEAQDGARIQVATASSAPKDSENSLTGGTSSPSHAPTASVPAARNTDFHLPLPQRRSHAVLAAVPETSVPALPQGSSLVNDMGSSSTAQSAGSETTGGISSVSSWARQGRIREAHWVASRICGTVGYVDPLFAETGEFNLSSDVYSLGMVLYDLLIGIRGSESAGDRMGRIAELDTAIDVIQGGARVRIVGGGSREVLSVPEADHVLDERIDSLAGSIEGHLDASAGKWPPRVAARLALLARACTSEDRNERPRMVDGVMVEWSAIQSEVEVAAEQQSREEEEEERARRQQAEELLQGNLFGGDVPKEFICPITMVSPLVLTSMDMMNLGILESTS